MGTTLFSNEFPLINLNTPILRKLNTDNLILFRRIILTQIKICFIKFINTNIVS